MKTIWTILSLLIGLDSFLRFILLLLRAVVPDKVQPRKTGAGEGRAILLLAARDEAGVIGETVRCLRPHLADWPGSALWIIADNCSDSTAKEARDAGASVASRSGGRLGKGAAIEWWIDSYRGEWKTDHLIVILDADSRLEAKSLAAMRSAFAEGKVAVQGFVKPYAETTPARLAGYSEVLMQRIDDEARRRCKWPVPLRGTGMSLSAPLLADLAPRLHTLAEDLELDVLLASSGVIPAFVPQVVVVDPKPRESRGVANQRARWFQGQLQVVRGYWRELLSGLWRGGFGAWMLFPLLFLRPKLLFIGLRILILMGAIVLGAPWKIIGVAIAMDLLYYLCGAAIMDNPRRYLMDLFSAPRYVFLWLYGLLLAAVKRGGWLRAGR